MLINNVLRTLVDDLSLQRSEVLGLKTFSQKGKSGPRVSEWALEPPIDRNLFRDYQIYVM